MQDHVPRQLAVGFTPMEHRREVVARLAMRAEELGYSTVYVAEGWGYDASVLLAEVALRTSRIRVGTGVLNVWGRSAASIAMLASSLADLSGGRFELGLGSGSPPLAEGFHDVPFRAPVARLGQVTRQVRRLLHGERIVPSVLGGSRPLRLAQPTPHVVPIQMAALRPRAVRLCGELADGWLPFLLPASGLDVGRRLLQEGRPQLIVPCPESAPAFRRRCRRNRPRPTTWPGGGSPSTSPAWVLCMDWRCATSASATLWRPCSRHTPTARKTSLSGRGPSSTNSSSGETTPRHARGWRAGTASAPRCP